MIKNILYSILFLFAMSAMVSCNNDETYAEQKEAEREDIKRYIAENKIRVISEEDFAAKGHTTDTLSNEYVLFSSSGVYMQIVNKGCGKPLETDKSATLLCRFREYNIKKQQIQCTNILQGTSYVPEVIDVTKKSGTFYASFNTTKGSVMNNAYGSSSVPAGWLVPLLYINIGRPVNDGDEIAHVKLIVPHNQGQSDATANVYPCFYDITYQAGI